MRTVSLKSTLQNPFFLPSPPSPYRSPRCVVNAASRRRAPLLYPLSSLPLLSFSSLSRSYSSSPADTKPCLIHSLVLSRVSSSKTIIIPSSSYSSSSPSPRSISLFYSSSSLSSPHLLYSSLSSSVSLSSTLRTRTCTLIHTHTHTRTHALTRTNSGVYISPASLESKKNPRMCWCP